MLLNVIYDSELEFNEIDKLTELAVSINGLVLMFVEEPDFDLRYSAVRQNPLSIVFAMDYLDEFYEFAEHADERIFEDYEYMYDFVSLMVLPEQLKNFKYQTDEMCIEAVSREPDMLQHVIDQTEEICLAAVRKDGMSLQYVTNQTEKICLAAVKQNSRALQYVHNQTEKVCIAACRKSGYALQYVQVQTEKVCLSAVKSAGYALQFVQKQTDVICLAAVTKSYFSYDLVQNKTYDITKYVSSKWNSTLTSNKESDCIKAVSKFWTLLENVQTQTSDICIAALKNSLNAKELIKYDRLSEDEANRVNKYITFLSI